MWKTRVLAAALAAACAPPGQDAAPSEAEGSSARDAAATAAPIRVRGTVIAVDAATGAITLEHAPIAAIEWPAMTMRFTAEDPAILSRVSVGDRVTFELKAPTSRAP